MSVKLYLEVLSVVNDFKVQVTVETYVTLFVYRFIKCEDSVSLYLVRSQSDDCSKSVTVDVCGLDFSLILRNADFEKEDAASLKLPVVVNEKCVVAGLCSVCRCLVKSLNNHEVNKLLGFKEGCLQAPSETSTWTKFCEIDFINCTKNIIELNEKNFEEKKLFELFDEFGTFEKHLAQPVRVHNIYKVARNLAKEKVSVKIEQEFKKLSIEGHEKTPRVNKQRKSKAERNPNQISSSVPIDQLNIPHTFAEGQEISLVDIILYSCYHLVFKTLPCTLALSLTLPLTSKWMSSLTAAETQNLNNSSSILHQQQLVLSYEVTYKYTSKEFPSLYKSDPKQCKPKNQKFTKQSDVSASLDKVNALSLSIQSVPMISTKQINWSKIPYEALPEGGQLPEKRLRRKSEQLECLAQCVLEIAKPGDRIIDFCCGAGHLGILLAYLLPQCQVILLENKEESLMRARERVDLLHLDNVRLYQCNLDYFIGNFDIGCSLHACGVATDIVLLHCLNRKANFVCCPCCYGGIHSVSHIEYPRSNTFKVRGAIIESEYMNIAHCADQAHDVNKGECNVEKSEQGQYCMDVVDTDRKLLAEEYGYKVRLMRLVPEECTPKNRLLVGVFDK
ncbi:Glutathione S-transferase C-terminal domain-containing protein like [Pseudolycoriella hygida]|uniref:Glutathione S-transferase C-terminal domain-containing protein like n=1 Tax=Pseudolycoriella hygida TaxID=35572 RepID=A0A9Q0S3P6_9DIPT|nr:Glutathione S-transferase C-terminal domain-containing protein like [Pseudolycoriella hygida]